MPDAVANPTKADLRKALTRSQGENKYLRHVVRHLTDLVESLADIKEDEFDERYSRIYNQLLELNIPSVAERYGTTVHRYVQINYNQEDLVDRYNSGSKRAVEASVLALRDFYTEHHPNHVYLIPYLKPIEEWDGITPDFLNHLKKWDGITPDFLEEFLEQLQEQLPEQLQ